MNQGPAGRPSSQQQIPPSGSVQLNLAAAEVAHGVWAFQMQCGPVTAVLTLPADNAKTVLEGWLRLMSENERRIKLAGVDVSKLPLPKPSGEAP